MQTIDLPSLSSIRGQNFPLKWSDLVIEVWPSVIYFVPSKAKQVEVFLLPSLFIKLTCYKDLERKRKKLKEGGSFISVRLWCPGIGIQSSEFSLMKM